MRQVYAVQGMSCSGCAARVTDILSAVDGIGNVEVILASNKVFFNSERNYPIEVLNGELAKVSKFRLHRALWGPYFSVRKQIKKFLPLIIMFGLVLAWVVFTGLRNGFEIHYVMQEFMGGYFLLFGLLKAFNWKNFVPAYRAYDDLARLSKPYAYAYPVIELLLGFSFTIGFALVAASAITLVLMSQKAWSVYKKLKSGEQVTCACLGGFFSIPVTWVTFSEDLLMALMACWMLLALR